MTFWAPFDVYSDYFIDAWQRSLMLLDTLRERGNNYWAHNAETAPHVLSFKGEPVCDGRTLPRPVNYVLVRIVPPEGTRIDPAKPPFVVVDPRAGHGPGIGGMKNDSEIGVALAAGHACYFIGFLPEPAPGQTIEDVCRAEAIFIEQVAARHPEAEGKPIVVANCQAGWQTMIMAALNPELCGPIMLAGSPLSYWAGVHGKNPMRYLGGLLGGTWMTALAGDLGEGVFDGANLVRNFESLNPANTYWEKIYNVWSKADTEPERFLEFETWWGSPVLMNAGEMQWITDNLFVGDKLATGALRSSEGVRIDLRNIRSPIVVFCSWGDNITPPQQALDWITDLYQEDREIVANGQTIVYSLHQSIGHLGIFVSGKVATKEHREFTSCMDLIDLLPPGLYEAVITEVEPDAANPELIDGRYLFRLEGRTLDDIRALGGNTPEDDLCFATAARVSEVNRALYHRLGAPAVDAMTTQATAEAMRALHPNRLRFSVFSDRNPAMQMVHTLANNAREERRPVSEDNPLLTLQETMSSWITSSLKAYGEIRDAANEALFLNVYGSPLLQALVGLDPQELRTARRIERDLAREARHAEMATELREQFETGGPLEAALRVLIYVRAAEGATDERAIAMLRQLRAGQPPGQRRPMPELKAVLREQSILIRMDAERAIKALPKLLPEKINDRRTMLDTLENVIAAPGELSPEGRSRLTRVEGLFNVKAEKPSKAEAPNV